MFAENIFDINWSGMQLFEIIRKLTAKGAPYFDREGELAKDLGAHPSQVSRIKIGPNPQWEEHFAIFKRLYYDLQKQRVVRGAGGGASPYRDRGSLL